MTQLVELPPIPHRPTRICHRRVVAVALELTLTGDSLSGEALLRLRKNNFPTLTCALRWLAPFSIDPSNPSNNATQRNEAKAAGHPGVDGPSARWSCISSPAFVRTMTMITRWLPLLLLHSLHHTACIYNSHTYIQTGCGALVTFFFGKMRMLLLRPIYSPPCSRPGPAILRVRITTPQQGSFSWSAKSSSRFLDFGLRRIIQPLGIAGTRWSVPSVWLAQGETETKCSFEGKYLFFV